MRARHDRSLALQQGAHRQRAAPPVSLSRSPGCAPLLRVAGIAIAHSRRQPSTPTSARSAHTAVSPRRTPASQVSARRHRHEQCGHATLLLMHHARGPVDALRVVLGFARIRSDHQTERIRYSVASITQPLCFVMLALRVCLCSALLTRLLPSLVTPRPSEFGVR